MYIDRCVYTYINIHRHSEYVLHLSFMSLALTTKTGDIKTKKESYKYDSKENLYTYLLIRKKHSRGFLKVDRLSVCFMEVGNEFQRIVPD